MFFSSKAQLFGRWRRAAYDCEMALAAARPKQAAWLS
jgi:aryl carrier-like protein